MGKALEFAQTVIIFLSVLGIAIWIGIVFKAEGEDKLVEACNPIEYTTNGLHSMTTALIGREPRWTLSLQRYLLRGCYYFFSVIVRDTDGNEGGIRQ